MDVSDDFVTCCSAVEHGGNRLPSLCPDGIPVMASDEIVKEPICAAIRFNIVNCEVVKAEEIGNGEERMFRLPSNGSKVDGFFESVCDGFFDSELMVTF